MIRLVTQFDAPQTRVAAVTPTCSGACCCCCSCIATIIGASIYTPMSVQGTLHRVEAEAPERVRWRSPWPGVLGALAAPLVLVTAFLTWWTVVGPSLLWFLLVGLAYRGAGHLRPWRRGAAVAAVGSVVFVIEFFVWAVVVLGSE